MQMPDFAQMTGTECFSWLQSNCIVAEFVDHVKHGMVLLLHFIDFDGMYRRVKRTLTGEKTLSKACEQVFIWQNKGGYAI